MSTNFVGVLLKPMTHSLATTIFPLLILGIPKASSYLQTTTVSTWPCLPEWVESLEYHWSYPPYGHMTSPPLYTSSLQHSGEPSHREENSHTKKMLKIQLLTLALSTIFKTVGAFMFTKLTLAEFHYYDGRVDFEYT